MKINCVAYLTIF